MKELGGYDGREYTREETPEGVDSSAEKKPDITVFHEQAKAAGAYEGMDERRRKIVEAYLTTPSTFKDLGPLAGGVSGERVKQLFNRGFRELLRRLPQEMKEEYSMQVEHTVYQRSGPPIRETWRRVRNLEDFEWPNKPYRPRKPYRRKR